MKTNWETALITEHLVLVPYRRKYVHRYHEWMKDPFLQEATASEPLTLEEEYAMQASWRDDEKKCTFILLDKTHPAASPPLFAPCTMVGDVNLFFNDPDGDMGVAEIEIMIAEPTRRGRGLGMEGVEAMMQYAIEALGVRRFYCKISDSNVASLRMFERIGYVRVAYVAAFKEVELEFLIREDQDWPQKICIVRDNLGKGGGVSMVPYRDEEGGKEGD
ncbi:hypothetical protein NSK_007733 [Nannochloropsis salina CCMP1776]|uniref:N-acetyltransferase domain-containing protein n=1 Tax=Nannochloropsis salina CCMP1776 TaxID=1027361 RepID=A0A4D9CPN8_9STRA|nr:hypothetical protein NSK_007733 [Nannochloropsis salina CCMP1776]|eukprot:TFJ81090.1 hypothetical protein NSK_007733 [Nannochloropsis salina CCMP1776]